MPKADMSMVFTIKIVRLEALSVLCACNRTPGNCSIVFTGRLAERECSTAAGINI